MNKWQDMFDIEHERNHEDTLHGSRISWSRYYLVDKLTKQRVFTDARPYGYSGLTEARIGAAHRFRHIQKTIEKELLGG